MTNQSFCYWLQGYFEISRKIHFSKSVALKIEAQLQTLNEPLGRYTQWLHDTLIFLKKQKYQQGLLDLFFPTIQSRLYSVFVHVIDTTYERTVSMEDAFKIHQGDL